MSQEFTIAGFAAFLGEMTLKADTAAHDALTKAAKLVQKEAKAEVGHYQDEIGGFPAWAELADSTKEDRVRHGFTENDPGLRTGEMRDSIHTTVEAREATIGSDDDKLVYFELGTTKQPPRTVLAGGLIRKEDEVVKAIGGTFVGKLTGVGVAGGSLPVVEGD